MQGKRQKPCCLLKRENRVCPGGELERGKRGNPSGGHCKHRQGKKEIVFAGREYKSRAQEKHSPLWMVQERSGEEERRFRRRGRAPKRIRYEVEY